MHRILFALFLLLTCLVSMAQAAPLTPKRYFALNFSSPLHLPDQRPTTGTGFNLPTAITGNPQVVGAAPILHQPLILNTEIGNGPCCYREGIVLALPPTDDPLVISFDLVTEKLLGSRNRLQLHLNHLPTPLLSFSSEGLVLLNDTDAIASFSDDHLLHLQLTLDFASQQLALSINGDPVYNAAATLPAIQNLRFLMTAESGLAPEQINPEPYAALDNIVVANTAFQYANLQTRLLGGDHFGKWDNGKIEFMVNVRNISDHPARDVVVTSTLPAGVSLDSVESDTLLCNGAGNKVICGAAQLAGMQQAFVTIRVNARDADRHFAFTSIAVSSTPEIDNYDNQANAQFGGGLGLIIPVLILLWWGKRRSRNTVRVSVTNPDPANRPLSALFLTDLFR